MHKNASQITHKFFSLPYFLLDESLVFNKSQKNVFNEKQFEVSFYNALKMIASYDFI